MLILKLINKAIGLSTAIYWLIWL